MDWTKIDPKYIAYTVDQHGQQALHSVKPTFNVNAGKWMSDGRLNLGLMQIHPDFSASGTLRMRPGHVKKQEAVATVIRAKPAIPQDVATLTPLEHMISSPPSLEAQAQPSKNKHLAEVQSDYLIEAMNKLSFVQDLPPRARELVDEAQKFIQESESAPRTKKPRKKKASINDTTATNDTTAPAEQE